MAEEQKPIVPTLPTPDLKQLSELARLFQNFQVGNIRQAPKKYPDSPPVYDKNIAIGSNSVYTIFRCWVRKATFKFNKVSIFIGMNNGKGSCFMKCQDLNVLQNMIEFLQSCIKDIEPKLPALLDEQKLIEDKQKEVDAIQSIVNNNGNGGDFE